MILSAGLTPAWQQIMVFNALEPGQVNRADEVRRCASGKAINAALAVAHLGEAESSLLLTPSGGSHGREMETDLARVGLPFQAVATEASTRVCTTLIDRATGEVTELVENGEPLSVEALQRYREAFVERAAEAEVAIVTGSLPRGCPIDYYDALLETEACPVVCDFRGPGLMQILPRRPLLVKPNYQELRQTLQCELESEEDLLSGMRVLNRKGAQWVLITRGGEGAWLSSEQAAYRLEPVPIPAKEIVNPIGCGDAVTGGFAWAMAEGREALEAAKIGLAAAAGNLRQLLPCRLDRAEVLAKAHRVRSEPIA
jgi:1-phosphofructokinase family hexose kinase